jgi:putative SOS response-associated peptidase YedK
MCGRFALHSSPEVIALEFGLQLVPALEPHYNIAPDAAVLVVRDEGPSIARWRFKGKTHNARVDSLSDKPLFRGAQRCLMPANGFYEWQRRSGGRQPYFVRPKGRELFALAGIWQADTCAVVTTAASGAMAPIHDRMPLIVARTDYRRWLDGGNDITVREAIVAFPVGDAVNSAANDSALLIRPVEPRGRDLFD